MWCDVKFERDHEAVDPSSFAEVCLTLSIHFTNPEFQFTQKDVWCLEMMGLTAALSSRTNIDSNVHALIKTMRSSAKLSHSVGVFSSISCICKRSIRDTSNYWQQTQPELRAWMCIYLNSSGRLSASTSQLWSNWWIIYLICGSILDFIPLLKSDGAAAPNYLLDTAQAVDACAFCTAT